MPAPRLTFPPDTTADTEVVVVSLVAILVLTDQGLAVRYWHSDHAQPSDLHRIGQAVAYTEHLADTDDDGQP